MSGRNMCHALRDNTNRYSIHIIIMVVVYFQATFSSDLKLYLERIVIVVRYLV